MELAKVTSKGQITVPIDIRKRYGLQEGSKVLFLEEGGRLYRMNSTMAAFSAIAGKPGINAEEDIVEMAKRFRKERAPEK